MHTWLLTRRLHYAYSMRLTIMNNVHRDALQVGSSLFLIGIHNYCPVRLARTEYGSCLFATLALVIKYCRQLHDTSCLLLCLFDISGQFKPNIATNNHLKLNYDSNKLTIIELASSKQYVYYIGRYLHVANTRLFPLIILVTSDHKTEITAIMTH